MLKHCEFENHVEIYANANCKLLRYMKKETIFEFYFKFVSNAKYAKYELCKNKLAKLENALIE